MKKIIAFFTLAVALGFQDGHAQIDFRKETIYFLLPTRFFDGDPANNRPNEWCSWYPGNPNNGNFSGPEDVTWRGDFKGLIQKLDYIKDLGFTAIWITPVVQNRGPLDYHGYHAWDFMKVDPRLESTGATFKDFVDAAHAKGIKVVLDIVTNHSGRFGIKGLSELRYNTDTTAAWGKNLQGTALKDNPNWDYDGLNANPDDGKLWSRANLAKMPPPFNQNLKAHNWPSTESFVTTSDPAWFHHSGNGFAQGWDDTTNLYQRALADDCPDLNTESAVVQNYLFEAYKKFLDAGVDAFRWDTWKHMSRQSILALYDRFKAYKPDLFVFGEVAQKRHELHPVEEINPHWYTWRGAVGSSQPVGVGVVDFYAMSTFHGVFQNGGALSGVRAAARYDHLYGDPSLLVTFLDNHDFGPNNDWNQRYGGTDENLAACMNFMFTWRGIPSVYYGTEARFKSGAFTDLHNAGGINRSINETGRAYFGDQMAAAQNHRIYKHIRKLNAIRKAIPALQNGQWQWAGNAPFNGVGYTRQSGTSFVCVGLAKDGTASFNFTGIQNGIYRDAVTGREVQVTNGSLAFAVTSGSAGIYVKDGPGMIGESGAGFFEPCAQGCTPPVNVSIAPVSDNYTSPITVSMQAAGGNGTLSIYYTTDGTEPTTSSTLYTGPFQLSAFAIVKALAMDVQGRRSEVQAQRYTFLQPPPSVHITPASGNYFDPISISINATSGVGPYQIFYTLDGTEPTAASAVYAGPIQINTPTTLKAITRDANNNFSSVVARTYTFNIPPPTVSASPAGGNFASGSVSVSLNANSPRPPVSIFYTTDNTLPTTSSSVYSSPIGLSGGNPDTLKYFAIDAEGRTSLVQTQVYSFYPIPDFSVYFKRPANWSTNVRIHYWNALPAGALASTTWPGAAMERVCGDWYRFSFSGITAINLVFNDGAGRQTTDLAATATAYYDNGWLPVAPDIDAPVANFDASPGFYGAAPLEITFNGSLSTSCNGITAYNWNFGNGQTGSGPQPTTTFTEPGSYLIVLTVTDNAGKSNAVSKILTVTSPAAGFWVYFKKPNAWSNNIKLRYWSRMPGNASIPAPGVDMQPHCGNWFKYFFSNTTSAYLSITDGSNNTGELQADQPTSFIGSRKVLGAPDNEQILFANFEINPATGRSPLSVNFNTEAAIGCSSILNYNWDFGNGNTGSGPSPTAQFNADGVYTINLAVSDPNGQVHNLSKKLVVGIAEPQLKVHFRRPAGWNNTPALYFWQPTPTIQVPAWPGIPMQDEGNGWYVLTVSNTRCANVVLNNSGSPQTADLLNVCGEQWYDNGWLSQIVPTTPLSVRLLSFSASWVHQKPIVQWRVDHESGVKAYNLERSWDGRTFETIHVQNARQTGTVAAYEYRDVAEVQGGRVYYRIQMKLNNGALPYSKTLALQSHSPNGSAFQIFPNPVLNQITLAAPGGFAEGTHYRLMNGAGQTVASGRLPSRASIYTVHKQAVWKPGIYLMQVLGKNGEIILRQKLMME